MTKSIFEELEDIITKAGAKERELWITLGNEHKKVIVSELDRYLDGG